MGRRLVAAWSATRLSLSGQGAGDASARLSAQDHDGDGGRAAARGQHLIQALVDARDEQTGEGINDTEIVDNLLTFIAAGHETTALALTWMLYLLSLNPEAEAKVLAEIVHASGPGGLDPDSVDGLAYTKQVIQESMRPIHRRRRYYGSR